MAQGGKSVKHGKQYGGNKGAVQHGIQNPASDFDRRPHPGDGRSVYLDKSERKGNK